MTNLNLFSQIISKLDRTCFKKNVSEKKTDKHQKGYSSWTHLVSMLFCQFAKSQFVRDISNGLRSATGNLNHLGIERAPSNYISSLLTKAKELQRVIRLHWGIENKLHWVLDVAFSEDASRKRAENASQNFSTHSKIALNLLKNEISERQGIKGKRLKAAYDQNYLLKILGKKV